MSEARRRRNYWGRRLVKSGELVKDGRKIIGFVRAGPLGYWTSYPDDVPASRSEYSSGHSYVPVEHQSKEEAIQRVWREYSRSR